MPINLTLSPAALSRLATQDASVRTTDDQPAIWPIFSAALGDAGDLVTTQLAMAKGAHETNPLLPSGRVANGVAQAAEALATQYLLHRFGPTHPLLAKLFGGSIGAIGAYSTLRNLQTMRAQDRYHDSGGLRE